MSRPVLQVLAGVNGAGKSSIGGLMLRRAGLEWFNPDAFARELMAVTGWDQETANGEAWREGVRRLDKAISQGLNYAFETTLGGRTIAQKVLEATRTHEVLVWFCGLASPEQHIARVQLRVAHGGHPIPEAKIRERYPKALSNLIGLIPHLACLRVYDNSIDAVPGEAVTDPVLVLAIDGRHLCWPQDVAGCKATPEWAKPLVEAALDLVL